MRFSPHLLHSKHSPPKIAFASASRVSQATPLNADRETANRDAGTRTVGEWRMVLAHHLIFTAYGFWLPNDPRGSWSDFVRNWELYWYGAATKVTTRRSLAHDAHNRDLRRLQKTALRYDPVRFTPAQIDCVARGFARAVKESGYDVLACSILPEHVHITVRRHSNPGGTNHRASEDPRDAATRPGGTPPVPPAPD